MCSRQSSPSGSGRLISNFVVCVLTSIMVFAGGCAGKSANGTAQLPAQPAVAALQSSAQFLIAVPNPPVVPNTRGAQYISPSTKSLTITPSNGPAVSITLSPTSVNCASASQGYVCTLNVSVPVGTSSFVLTTYDGGGNALSTNNVPPTLITAAGVKIPVTLYGIVQKAVLRLATTNPPTGATAAIPLYVELEDADGNLIIGSAPYENAPVTLTNSDSSGATKVSLSTLNAPGDASNISVTYTGAALRVATFSVTAAGLNSANVLPAILNPQAPQTLSANGSGAIATLAVHNTLYAFVPLSEYGGTGLVEIPLLASGGFINPATPSTTAQTARRARQTQSQLAALEAAPASGTCNLVTPAGKAKCSRMNGLSARTSQAATRRVQSVNPTIAGSDGVTTCTGDQPNLKVYCGSANNGTIIAFDASVVPAKEINSFPVDTNAQLMFSGGSCTVCGIAYDPTDNGVLVSTANGYELYSAGGTHVKTVTSSAAENFGYNGATNQILSASYAFTGAIPGEPGVFYSTSNVDLIDVGAGVDYSLNALPASLTEPDQTAIDSSTDVGLATEEFANGAYETAYVFPLSTAAFDTAGQLFSLPSAIVGSLNSSIFESCGTSADGVTIDSLANLVFFNAEYCNPSTFGAAEIDGSSAPALNNLVFGFYPNTPDGNIFSGTYDPHTLAVSSSTLGDYALSFNAQGTYLAVINLKKLEAAPRSAADSTLVDPNYDLFGNGVLTYFAI